MAIAERELTRIINPEPNRFGPVEAPLRVPKVEPIQEDPATRQRAEAAARADTARAFEDSKAVEPKMNFYESHEPFVAATPFGLKLQRQIIELIGKPEAMGQIGELPLPIANGLKLINNLKEYVERQRQADLQANQISKSDKDVLSKFQDDLEDFIRVAASSPEVINKFWTVFDRVPGNEALQHRKAGALAELAMKRFYLENGYRVMRAWPKEDELGIDFFVERPLVSKNGGYQNAELEIHQVKAHPVDSAAKAAQYAGKFINPVPLGLGYDTDRPRKENVEMSGWGKFFKKIGKILPAVRHDIPFYTKNATENTTYNNGQFSPGFKALLTPLLIKH